MQSHSRIFTDKYLDIKSAPLEKILSSGLEEKKALIKDWQEGIRSGRILQAKEEQLQSSFLRVFFGDVLGYVHSKGSSVWNLEEEQKTLAGSTKMDGALGFFSLDSNGKTCADIKVVIELKDARTDLDKPQTRKNDRRTPVQQAFDYAGAMGGTCRWVIVSNFLEIRLYFHNDRTRYESFDIPSLDRDMKRFLFLLHKDRLTAEKGESFTDTLYRERQEQEKNISRQFYADYRHARLSLFHHIREQNADISESLLLTKTQKLLDRLLFVCFCEDFGILPYFTFRGLLKNVKEDRFNRSDSKIYERVKALFDAINSGYPEENINKFNGGLFADDEILDGLMIKDAVLEHVIELERYDFASDLNVNILGHIFEQSVTDMEELKAEIAGQDFDRKKGKRKKEGIYYTPEYITRYIVEEAVGGWLADRKSEIGFDSLPELTQADYDSVKKISKKRKANKNIELHIQALEAYREKLKNIRVLDPACGSGAFLNQVFDFLYKEGQKVNSEIAMLKRGQREVFDLDKDILTNNIFGVDLNDESAEITKLSLWLKTANRNKELTTLDANIKCGNSMIDDPAVAGEKAFDWNAEFPEIMKNGGFDVVVGNPPYVDSENMTKNQPDIRKFISNNYITAKGNWDLYIPFIEKSMNLLANSGYCGMITPNKWLSMDYGKSIRKFLKNNINAICDYSKVKVFEDAGIFPVVFTASKCQNNGDISINLHSTDADFESVTVSRNAMEEKYACNFGSLLNKNQNLTEKLSKFEKLGSVCTIAGACTTSEAYEYIPLIKDDMNLKNSLKLVNTGTIDRFAALWGFNHTTYIKKKYLYPIIEIDELKKYFPKRFEKIYKPKIIISGIRHFESFYDRENLFLPGKSTNIIKKSNDQYPLESIVCLLNSRLMTFFIKQTYSTSGMDGGINFSPSLISQLPVPVLSSENQADLSVKSDKIHNLNNRLQILKQKFLNRIVSNFTKIKITRKINLFYASKFSVLIGELKKQNVILKLKQQEEWEEFYNEYLSEINQIQLQIDKTDSEIDQMVYDLYGMTKEEIRIVEGTDSKMS